MRWLVALALTACSFEPGAFPRDDAGTADDDAIRDGDGSVIDTPPDAPSCSTDGLFCIGTTVAMTCNNGCWVSCTSFLAVPNQPTAAQLCTEWGGKLAPIRDAGDQACVSQTLFPDQASWIGFEQAPGAMQVAAAWSFNSDGAAIANPGWGAGQPDDGDADENGAENCASMSTSGDWHDTPCSNGGLYRLSCRKD